jgi:hypothetical protein
MRKTRLVISLISVSVSPSCSELLLTNEAPKIDRSKHMWCERNGWFVYSCCSHLEHRASAKRFVSLQFLNLRHSVGLPEGVISTSQGRYLTQTKNKHKQTSMTRVGLEPMILAFERAKTVHALDRAATVIGVWKKWRYQNLDQLNLVNTDSVSLVRRQS